MKDNDTNLVSLIANGYEWNCPCGKLNRINEYPRSETVTCERCKKVYSTDIPEHAYQ